jgi:hypothetical protein
MFCGQAEVFAGFIDELGSAFAVCFGCACDFRDALTDDGFGDDHLGLAVIVGFGVGECLRDGCEIVAIDGDGIPLLGAEIGLGIFASLES